MGGMSNCDICEVESHPNILDILDMYRPYESPHDQVFQPFLMCDQRGLLVPQNFYLSWDAKTLEMVFYEVHPMTGLGTVGTV